MKLSQFMKLAQSAPVVLNSLQALLASEPLGEQLPPVINMSVTGLPSLSPAYKISSDWPKFSFGPDGFEIQPTMWVRHIATNRSVRVAFSESRYAFRVVGRNYIK